MDSDRGLHSGGLLGSQKGQRAQRVEGTPRLGIAKLLPKGRSRGVQVRSLRAAFDLFRRRMFVEMCLDPICP